MLEFAALFVPESRRNNSTQQHFDQTRERCRIAVDEVELLEVLKARVDLIA
jgi:hypothetical protein